MKTNWLRLIRPFFCLLTLGSAALAAPACLAQQPGGRPLTQADVAEYTQVLNPGKADDWPLEARDGETVIAGVRSNAFDPVVALVDANGTVVAENDDVRPGVKDALLLRRVAAGGAYRVRVRASEAQGTGTYRLTVRRFVATDLPLGTRAAGTLGRSLLQWHRLALEGGRTAVVTAHAAGFAPAVEVYAPNGEPVRLSLLDAGQGGLVRASFRALQPGDYHIRVAGTQGAASRATYAVTVALARVFETALGRAEPGRCLDAGGLDIWVFEGKPGDLVRIRATAPGEGMAVRFSFSPPVDEKSGEPRPVEGPVPPVVLLPSDEKQPGEVVALLNVMGHFQVDVSHPRGLEAEYTLATDRPLQEPRAEGELAGKVGLGEADYWAVRGTTGQILRFEGIADQFDIVLSLYTPRGELAAQNDDGAGGRNALLTALALEGGTYLLRVHSRGDGGSGAYRVHQVAKPDRPLVFGGRGEGSVGAGGTEVWSFQGTAGQTVILAARSTEFDPRLALFGPQGDEVASDDRGSEAAASLLSVRLPVTGSYTVWLSARAGGGRYSVHLMELK